MLVLFETPAGFCLFRVADDKLEDVSKLDQQFTTPEKARETATLQAFARFRDTAEALAATTALAESKLGESLEKFLKDNIVKKGLKEQLAVMDAKVGNIIMEKLGVQCVSDNRVMHLMRGIRSQLSSLIDGLEERQPRAMMLDSADKVDTMIVQAIGLLDELDKKINTYATRVQELYGWHFPEMATVINDNLQYAHVIMKMGMRRNAGTTDLSAILPNDVASTLEETAITSMGTDITEADLLNINMLCNQVVTLSGYRVRLLEYLQQRMRVVAPNLTVMVGELVGARLIARTGSLLNLAKQPASTVQILGAEKALFRALKTKRKTPKYGLLSHASLVGHAAPKNKGKISRMLAAKAALSARVDAPGDLRADVVKEDLKDQLAVMGARVSQLIKQSVGVRCVSGTHDMSLVGGTRSQLTSLMDGYEEREGDARASEAPATAAAAPDVVGAGEHSEGRDPAHAEA